MPVPPPWEEVASQFQADDQGDLSYWRRVYEGRRQLAIQRTSRQGDEEGVVRYITRRAIPFYSAIANFVEAGRASRSRARIDAGQWDDDDIVRVASYDREQERDSGRGLGGQLLSGLAHIPAIAGEFAVGGAAVRAVGLGASAAAQAPGMLARAGGALGRTAAITPLTPSSYLPQIVENNQAAGRPADSWRGAPAALGTAYINNLVLGPLSQAAASVIPGQSIGAAVARTALARPTAGIAEQAIADVVTSGLGLSAGYGTLGQLYRGEYGEALQHVVQQGVTFAAFGAMHEIQERRTGIKSKKKEESPLKPLAEALAEMKEENMTPEQAARHFPSMPLPAPQQGGRIVPPQQPARPPQADPYTPNAPNPGQFQTFPDSAPRHIQPPAEAPLPPPQQPSMPRPAPAQGGMMPMQRPIPPEQGGMVARDPAGEVRGTEATSGRRTMEEYQRRAENEAWAEANQPEVFSALDERGITPQRFADKFFSDIYPTLDPANKKAVNDVLARQSSFKPGDTIGFHGDTPIKAESWRRIGQMMFEEYRTFEEMTQEPSTKPLRGLMLFMAQQFIANPQAGPRGVSPGRIPLAESQGGMIAPASDPTQMPGFMRPRPAEPPVPPMPRPSSEPTEMPGFMRPVPPATPTKPAPAGTMEAVKQRWMDAETKIQQAMQENPGISRGEAREISGAEDIRLEDVVRAARLKPEDQHVLIERLQGRTHEDIAGDFDVKKQAVQQREAKALKALGLGESIKTLIHEKEKARMEAMKIANGEAEDAVAAFHTDPAEGRRIIQNVQSRMEGDLQKLQDLLGKEAMGVKLTKADQKKMQKIIDKYPTEAFDVLAKVRDQKSANQTQAAALGGREAGGVPEAAPEASPEVVPSAAQRTGPGVQPQPPSIGPEGARYATGMPGDEAAVVPKRREGGGRSEVALANAKLDELAKQDGRQATTKQAEQSNPESWRKAMARLESDPRAGERLVDELSQKLRTTDVVERALLVREMVVRRGELSAADKALDKATTPEARAEAEARLDTAMLRLDQLDRVISHTASEGGRSLQFQQQIIRDDFSLGSMFQKARAAKRGRLERTEMEIVRQDAKDIEVAQKEVDRLEDVAAATGGAMRTAPELNAARSRLRTAKQKFDAHIQDFRDANRTPVQRVIGVARDVMDLSRTLRTNAEVSGIGRQGGMALLMNPIITGKAALKSFKSMLSKEAAAETHQEVIDSPNSKNGLYAKMELALPESGVTLRQEESYRSKWFDKLTNLPGMGWLGAFERYHNTFLTVLRSSLADHYADSIAVDGKITDTQARGIGNFVNAATGHGKLPGKLNDATTELSWFLFSPRNLASRIQVAIGEPIWNAGDPAVRNLVAWHYARAAISAGMIYGIARVLGDDKTLTGDPRSSDFGKVRIGDVRIDPIAGMSQAIILTSRLASGSSVNEMGGVVPLRGEGSMRNAASVVGDYSRSKLAPIPSALLSLAAGRQLGDPKYGLQHAGRDVAIPMIIGDIHDVLRTDFGVAPKVALSLTAYLGAGVRNHRAEDDVDEFHRRLGIIKQTRQSTPLTEQFPHERDYRMLQRFDAPIQRLNDREEGRVTVGGRTGILTPPDAETQRMLQERQRELARRALGIVR